MHCEVEKAMERKRSGVRQRCWLACCLMSVSVDASASAELLMAQPITPGSEITVSLPESAAADSQWLLELNNTDVSPLLVESEPGKLSLIPPSALPTGDHQLRLVEMTPAGDLHEHGVWTFTVRHSARFREAGLNARLDVTVSERLDEDNLPEPLPDSTVVDGGLRVGATAADGQWRSSAVVEALGTSRDPLEGSGRDGMSLGYVHVQGQHGPWQWTAGDQIPLSSTLLMQPVLRRGLSAGLSTEPVDVILWSLRTPPPGGGSALWTREPERRSDGASLTHRPIADAPESLSVTVSWLQGEGPSGNGEFGSGVLSDPETRSGEASSVALESWLFDERVHWQGEYAWSSQESDADSLSPGPALEEQRDEAWDTRLTWYPLRNWKLMGQPVAMSTGIERREVGTAFYSPTNPQMLADRSVLGGYGSLFWAGLSLQAYLGTQDDNVDDNPLLPVTELEQQSYSLGYAPLLNGNGWLGQPAFNLSWQNTDQDVSRAAALLSEGDLYRNQQMTASLAIQYPRWSWDLAHSRGRDRSEQTFLSDLETELSQLSVRLPMGERLTLEPYGQRAESMNRLLSDDDSTLSQAGMTLGMQWSRRVWSSLTYTWGRLEQDGADSQRLDDVQGSVNWQWRQPRGWVPGVSLNLGGQYYRQPVLDALDRENQWQVFAGVTASWARTGVRP